MGTENASQEAYLVYAECGEYSGYVWRPVRVFADENAANHFARAAELNGKALDANLAERLAEFDRENPRPGFTDNAAWAEWANKRSALQTGASMNALDSEWTAACFGPWEYCVREVAIAASEIAPGTPMPTWRLTCARKLETIDAIAARNARIVADAVELLMLYAGTFDEDDEDMSAVATVADALSRLVVHPDRLMVVYVEAETEREAIDFIDNPQDFDEIRADRVPVGQPLTKVAG